MSTKLKLGGAIGGETCRKVDASKKKEGGNGASKGGDIKRYYRKEGMTERGY